MKGCAGCDECVQRFYRYQTVPGSSVTEIVRSFAALNGAMSLIDENVRSRDVTIYIGLFTCA